MWMRPAAHSFAIAQKRPYSASEITTSLTNKVPLKPLATFRPMSWRTAVSFSRRRSDVNEGMVTLTKPFSFCRAQCRALLLSYSGIIFLDYLHVRWQCNRSDGAVTEGAP